MSVAANLPARGRLHALRGAQRPALLLLAALTALGAIAKLAWWRTALMEDPAAYIYVGHGLLHGDTPYVDAAEPKGILTHLLYGVMAEISGTHVVVLQILGLLFVVAGAFALAKYVEHWAGAKAGIVAAVAMVLLAPSPEFDGQDINTEHTGIAFLVAAWWLGTRGTVKSAAAAGAFGAFGIGMNLGFAPIALFVLIELIRCGPPKERAKRCAAAIAGGALLLLPFVLWIVLSGSWDDAKFVVWDYARKAAKGNFAQYTKRDATARDLLNVHAGGLWVMGLAGCAIALSNAKLRGLAITAALWIVVMWVRVKINRGPEFNHHFFLGLPGICAGIAVGIASVTQTRTAALATLALALPVWTYVVGPEWRASEQTIVQRGGRAATAYPIAEFIERTTPKGAPIFVAGSEAEIYWLAHRRAPTRLFANYLLFTDPLIWPERADTLKKHSPAAIAAIDPEGPVDPGGQDVNALISERGYRLKYDVNGGKVWLHPKYAAGVKKVTATP